METKQFLINQEEPINNAIATLLEHCSEWDANDVSIIAEPLLAIRNEIQILKAE